MSATSGTNVAAVAHALKEATGSQMAFAAAAAQHGVVGGKLAENKDVGMHGYPSPPSSLPTPGPLGVNGVPAATLQLPRKGTALLSGSAIVDGHAPDRVGGISRNRRASEGAASALSAKGIRGRSTSELKCEKCGKGYKHSSCLTKHLFVLPLRVVLKNFVSIGQELHHIFSPTPHFLFWSLAAGSSSGGGQRGVQAPHHHHHRSSSRWNDHFTFFPSYYSHHRFTRHCAHVVNQGDDHFS